MKLLLDTHAALWFLAGDDRLSRDRATSPDRRQQPRAAQRRGGLGDCDQARASASSPCRDEYLTLLLSAGVTPLAVSVEHAGAVAQLPPHHRDPFDRMLVAQATFEGAALVSGDAALRDYGIPLIW